MKEKRFIGIDNGKHGAIAIIDIERNIIDAFKYEESNTLLLYEKLKPYCNDNYELFAFLENPIIVYGLAHQSAPFEIIGRHKMTLEILGIPYRIGNPRANDPDNWKRIIGIFDNAKIAAHKNTKEISAFNKKIREIKVQAELLGYGEHELRSDKIAYMDKNLVNLALEYRELKKKVSKLKDEKKKGVKETSIEACLQIFPDASQFIELKSKRSTKKKYDDDIAEAILLAECGRTLHINENF